MYRSLLRALGPSALVLALFACSDAPLGPSASAEGALFSTGAALPPVVISQVYGGGGNSGATLRNDFIELFNPGTEPVSLAGWSVQYASAAGSTWQVTALSGSIQPGGYYLVQQAAGAGGTVSLPTPDATGSIAMAAGAGKVWLVGATTAQSGTCPTGAAVIDQVSYGTTATNCGFGTTATLSNTTAALRLAGGCTYTGNLAADFATGAPSPRNSGSPATSCDFTPPPPPPPGGTAAKLVINEIMGDPVAAESASWGEWFEVYNADTVEVNLQGWTIASGGQVSHVIQSAVVIPVGGYAVLGRGHDPARNGGVTLDYNYFTGTSTIWLDDSDWLVLRDGAGVTADSVRWSGASPGASRALRDATQDNADANGANWGYSTTPFGSGDLGTPGAPNGVLTSTPPAPPTGVASISFTGRSSSDPPLPVGFEDQLFATARNASGAVVVTTFTWGTTTPGIASVDQNGVVRAKAAGTAVITATSADGRTGSFQLPTRVAVASATAVYAGNTEFGEPADGDPSDDFIVRRDQFSLSYSKTRNTPNWVSYSINPTNFGPEDRCDCFSPDPALPGDYATISTADYTGAGAHHGYGIDRGHLVRSFDRTAGSLDNAITFYFSNIIPQAADNNQGPWAVLEDSLGKLARNHGRAVYVVAGVSGSIGTVKDEGKIVIPARTWKVAVIMPAGKGLADVSSPEDVEVIAVDMPNQAGIRNTPWHTFKTTVDAIEAASGYDVLDKLPDAVERIVESGTRYPTARVDGPYTGTEGSPVHFDAGASTDPDGDALTFAWDFGDGSTGTGAAPTHTYADNGNYVVKVTVSDPYGASGTATTSVMVVNVAPTVAAFPGATLVRGQSYAAAGSFTDPGSADTWTATVDYGDGSGPQPLALSGTGFALSRTYSAAGTYTVTVRVTDDDGDTGTRTATVVVQTPAQGAAAIVASVNGLVADGTLTPGEGSALNATLDAARASAERDRPSAVYQMRAFVNQVEALRGSGRLSAAEAQRLIDAANAVIASLGG